MTDDQAEPVNDDEARLDAAFGAIAQLDKDVTGLAEEHDALADAVDSIADYLRARPGGPWLWSDLGPEEKADLWGQLFVWVNWLERRYLQYLSQDRYGLRPCWYLHPVIVEHLTALMVSHASAYRVGQAAPSAALVEWHERSFWPTIARFKEFFTKCTLHKHVEPEIYPMDLGEEAFQDYVHGRTGIDAVLYRPRSDPAAEDGNRTT
ncbi:hypothetical protein [Agreia sp. COWG]|uniref:hypothetical protein n=1 Tax=Agreia sp. COWG TaxID=2773266 RepID=UPI001925A879|nr:hypothetical protein [Agreia sp. COWG]CAD6015990.1 conserved protein of unknown function [Agreia sp. COWG]